MGRKEVLAERKALEEYYYNCKLETPEEVARLRGKSIEEILG